MKLVGASIILFAAAVLITGGAHVQHDDTQLFVMALGCGLGVFGLVQWFLASRDSRV